MMGFTRCASTSCFTQAAEYMAGVPLCPEHREELRSLFASATAPKKSLIDPTLEPLDLDAVIKLQRQQKAGRMKITSRAKLTPHQGSVDADTAGSAGCVYYVVFRRSTELVKIGTTTQAGKRFRTLCSQAGDRLRLLVAEPGGRDQERDRHGQFAHLRIEGTEFFQYTPEIVDHVALLRQRFPHYRDFTDVGMSFD